MIDLINQFEWVKYLTALIAIIGSYIGYQQYKLNKYKTKLDLYEKRYVVYNGYKLAIATLLRNGYLNDDELREYLIATKQSQFLFDAEIIKHIDDVYSKFVHIQLCHTQLLNNSDLDDDLKKKYAFDQSEILTHFNRLIKECDKKYFTKYFDFSKLY